MESIEEIRDALAWYRGVVDAEGWADDERSTQADVVMFAALDELAALRTQVAQMRLILEDLVAQQPFRQEHCVFCFSWRAKGESHKPDCPIARAQQILAKFSS